MRETTKATNERAEADAECRNLFPFQHPLPRATQAERSATP